MPNSLAQLTDAYADQPETIDGLPVEPLYLPNVNTNDIQLSTGEGVPTRITVRPQEPVPVPALNDFNTSVGTKLDDILNKLTGSNGKERYQLWPEKIVREGLSAAGDVMKQGTLNPGLRREDITDIPAPDMPTNDSTWFGKLLNIAPVAASPQDSVIEKAQAISALAGTGGLAGTTDATLGATPFLRPALKYKDRLYKGKEGQQHQDIIPKELYPEFEKMAMSGEDISHYNFGFVNDKGQFLSREKALDYGINTGLIDPHAGKYGALTSTLMADSSKPGTAIEAMSKTGSKNIDWNLIKTADDNLTGPAAKAIDSWVGGDKNFKDNGGMFGIWHPKALKEAIKTPEIKAQLDAVMEPIKAHLKAEHGDTITLYRNHGDLPEGAKSDRELLSFTSDKDFAENGFGAPKERKLYTEDEIKAKEKEFVKTGKVQIDKSTWLEKKTEMFDPAAWGQSGEPKEITYTAIMRPDGMVTDTDSVRAYLKDINTDRAESNAIREKKLKNVVTKEIPIDDIVYATDRFGQKEFIVQNKNKDLFADSSKEAAALQALKNWHVKGHENQNWFHGTTHDFDKFSLAKGNVENHLGQYPHFTNNPKDASANYAGHGPDLTARIERRAEELFDKARDKYSNGEVGDDYGKVMTAAKRKATEELAGPHDGAIIPAKLKMDNPADVTPNGKTWIDFAAKYDKDGEFVKDNPNTLKLLNSLKKQGDKYGFDGQKVFNEISEKAELYDSIKAHDLYKALRDNEELMSVAEHPKGKGMAGSHVLATVFKDLGFDGIVMDAKSAFPHMKNIDEGTLHAVPLKKNTVKSKITDQTLFSKGGYMLVPVDHTPDFGDKK